MSKVKQITPEETRKFLDSNPKALFVDVRSNVEFLYVGHPVGAIHIPWIDEPDWTVNPDFVKELRKAALGGVAAHTPIVLICRSGHRSNEAGKLLIESGFTEVYNVAGGFEGDLDATHHRSTVNGWRNAGLPWEQT